MADSRSDKVRRDYMKRSVGEHRLHPETQMMGYGYDPSLSEGALKPPLFLTSTFAFDRAQDGKEFFELAYQKREASEGEEMGLIYSRINNPNYEILEDRLALWEEAEKGLVFASGMSAISTALWAYLRPGDVLVHSEPIYGGTEFLARNILPEFGVKTVSFRAGGPQPTLAPAVEKARSLGRVAVIYTETPANPTNDLVDLNAARQMADRLEQEQGYRPIVMTDNTFLGPVWQKPLQQGADIVLYSLTKYIAGHSDVVAGAAIGSKAVMTPVQGFRTILGTQCDPHSCWLVMRSLETLKLRMEKSNENAARVAAFLKDHPKVTHVNYLGFLADDDPNKAIYDRQCLGAGSTFAFTVKGDEAAAFRVLDALSVIKLAVSLGGTESLMEAPYSMTHSDVPDHVKDGLGMTPSMLRISVGVEHPDDLIADLAQALDHA
ncbi:cystathionine gamma-synthase family protein [Yunchengibacter salinarum]|uniref:cystathionine gamma-synthase family protein n=1 Tax=Yunchengibacter salinarum TaxID=3133399 RepID=UPI0035B685D9